jgi:hypothetical protein
MASRFAVPWTAAEATPVLVDGATVGVDPQRSQKKTAYVQNRTVSSTILDEDICRNGRAARRNRYYNQVFDVKTLREFSTG